MKDFSEKRAKFQQLRRTIRNWPRALLDHLQWTKADYVCHLRDGASLNVRGGTDDRDVIFEQFVEPPYPADISRSQVVVDIGAQIGAFTVWAARKGARVFAYEPYPPNFAALERNVARNNLEKVSLNKSAIAGMPGPKKLFLPADKTHSGRPSLFSHRGSETIDVECSTLEEVMATHRLERIDLLNLDCQGAEYDIIYKASPEMIARISTIVVKCEKFAEPGEKSLTWLAGYLAVMGFEIAIRRNVIYAAKWEKNHPVKDSDNA